METSESGVTPHGNDAPPRQASEGGELDLASILHSRIGGKVGPRYIHQIDA